MAAAVPMLSTTAVTPSGFYARWRGRWLPTIRRGISADGRTWTLSVPAGDDVPGGFDAAGGVFGSAASGTVDADEVDAVSRVQTQCLWKNQVWWVDAVDRRAGEAVLRRWSGADLPDFVARGPGPSPQTAELGRMPGVYAGESASTEVRLTVRVRVSELARVGSRLWAATVVAQGDAKIVVTSGDPTGPVQVTSLPESPWLPAADAVALVRMHGDLTDEECDAPLQAERWRDGWFVWAGDGVVRWGEHDQRITPSSWIVADDRVVQRVSGESSAFGGAPQRLTDGMFERTLQISRDIGIDVSRDDHAQRVSGPTVPLDGRTLYPSGGYVLWHGRWFLRSTAGRRVSVGSVKIGVGAGEPIPDGFDAVTRPRAFGPVAQAVVPTSEIDAVCGVRASCTWKNSPWDISGLDPVENTALLTIATSVPRGYQQIEPRPHWTEFTHWPGVEGGDREWISAPIRPREAARVNLELIRRSVNALSENKNGDDIAWGIAVESVSASPWLPADEAIALVRDRLTGEDVGDYPVDRLQADRLRDGWRVWAPPPRSDDPLGFRIGWAVWYVADDGVMWTSSTSTSFEQASSRMTDQLFDRLQARQR